MKKCFKCGIVKPLDDFYKHPAMGDGHVNKCKECNKRDVQENYRKNIDYFHAYDRDRYQTLLRRVVTRRSSRTHKVRNPEKYEARAKLAGAIKSGKMKRLPCEVCGNVKSQGHHDDYSKPLEVRWFCFKHHREIGHGQTVTAA